MDLPLIVREPRLQLGRRKETGTAHLTETILRKQQPAESFWTETSHRQNRWSGKNLLIRSGGGGGGSRGEEGGQRRKKTVHVTLLHFFLCSYFVLFVWVISSSFPVPPPQFLVEEMPVCPVYTLLSQSTPSNTSVPGSFINAENGSFKREGKLLYLAAL